MEERWMVKGTVSRGLCRAGTRVIERERERERGGHERIVTGSEKEYLMNTISITQWHPLWAHRLKTCNFTMFMTMLTFSAARTHLAAAGKATTLSTFLPTVCWNQRQKKNDWSFLERTCARN